MEKKTIITIFTPTYNRGYILKEAYKSLKEQTSNNFFWLIVDDGSTDNTKKLVKKWKEEKNVNIIYIYQANQGKHIAINTGIDNCKTDFILCLDSDDKLEKNAIEVLEKKITENNMENIWAIVGPRKKHNGRFNWPNIKDDKIKFCWLYSKYNYKGETYLLMQTNCVKEYKFPQFENEKFIPESVLYNAMDNKYWIIICNEPIYSFEYLNDGYSKSGIKGLKNNAYGSAFANLDFAQQVKLINKRRRIIYFARYMAMVRTFKLDKRKFFNANKENTKDIKLISFLFSILFELRYRLLLYKEKNN